MLPPVGTVELAALPTSAAPPDVGTKMTVPLPAREVVVAVIAPVVCEMAKLVRFEEAEGATKPWSKAVPLEAFSATAVLAPDAATSASDTRARTV